MPKVTGRVINVVNQIPFECILDREDHHDVSVAEHMRAAATYRRQREGSLSSNGSGNSLEAPISHLAKRRSTMPTLGETDMWRLNSRRGHSAMYSGLDSLKPKYDTLYIGSTGNIMSNHSDHVPSEEIREEERNSLGSLLFLKHQMIPIFLDDKLAHGHYEGYCKQVLWPLLHYVMWDETVDEKKFWEAYVAVNRIFADTVADHYREGDQIWIHDYHLLLVPQMLREKLPNAPIGNFIHTPFVSSEIFRCLPRRKDILQGMLGSNLIAFQTYNYARHFASNCTRILGYEYTPAGVDANGTIVSLGIHPIGIDADRTRRNCKRPGVMPKIKAMQQKFKGKKIIVGRDKLDPVKGIFQKLESFEKFLTEYPEWKDQVVLIQVTAPGVINAPKLDVKLAEIINRINSKFGSLEFTPVQHFHQHIDRDEYYALLTVADIMLVTPTADGMNTTGLEYVVAQEANSEKGSLILSEFTGTARSLSAATIINPYDYAEISSAINDCLKMSADEKESKLQQLDKFVSCHTASYWAVSLVRDLLYSCARQSHWGPTALLEEDRVKVEYNAARKRLLFFDYDGTLTPICDKPDDAVPSKKTLEALEGLCKDPHNTVWVVSGRDQGTLDKWLGHIPNLGLSSEHGCFIKDPNTGKWTSMIDQIDMAWKDDVEEVFKYYTERTPGSFVENKRGAVTWHYRTADPKFGAFQAKECQNHLEQSIISKMPVETLVGKKTLEVRPMTINKGEVIKRAMSFQPDAGFVLCAGDDKTDEDMFRVLGKMKRGGVNQIIFTVTIGPADKRTLARWRIDTSEQFVNVIAGLP
ncbi:glycosyltransferase family 20-domain-containing protein [Syncephalastrum racemosum]|uniref:Glycosyltransferase family 20-domain-containing protein n=1 Tax=Syncephalastrum racemosum TaxID=13706 RepID=A0A1X2H3N9_SYNRA|nr:glycosyltransferase family 20-domain-containing protein [Syncephalastrum racemosum]